MVCIEYDSMSACHHHHHHHLQFYIVKWTPELWAPWVQVLHALCVFQILVGETYVEGFYIRFRDVSGGSQQYNMVTVLNAGSTSYTVANLRKFTKYEFFLVPFFKSIEGQPSNSKNVQTAEDGKQ